MAITMENLKQGHRYLVNEGNWDKYINEILVVEVSEKAYYLQWNKCNTVWIAKSRFNEKYNLYETLGDTIAQFNPTTSA